MTVQPTESILIVDFGSQVTQLIARRVREAGVYCEIAPFNAAEEAFERLQPKGIILSGGPASVTEDGQPARAADRCSTAACRSSASATASRRLRQQLGGRWSRSDQTRIRPRLHRHRRASRPCSTGCGKSARSTRCG